MPDFRCETCDASFSLKKEIIDRYPGWTPRFCLKCSPKKGASKKRSAPRAKKTSTVEENITIAEVLARYSGGPSTGLFTDGACSPNPGPGGWGVVHVVDSEVMAHKHGHDRDTTNNRMELVAIIEGFKMVDAGCELTLFTDSNLCVQTLEQWAKGWQARGWRRKTGPIKNLELVKEAYALRLERPKMKVQHIRAHEGNRWNEYADALATAWNRETL